MTQFQVAFSNKVVPSFTPTFDGSPYICKLFWNLSAQRYYVLCTDLDNNLIFFVPLVTSLPGIQINSLTWDSVRKIVSGVCSAPHNIPVNTVCIRSILDSVPAAYNGTYYIRSTGATTFSYPMKYNPNVKNVDSATTAGSLNQFISITAGYFNSVMIFRNNVFEVLP